MLLKHNASRIYQKQNKLREGKVEKPATPDILGEENEEEKLKEKEEMSVNYLKNTPLLWAVIKGDLESVWLLLNDGYSPNDTDNLNNNCLHLAAAAGNKKILQVLIDDGAKSTVVNIYKNTPVDMATNKDIREILSIEMVKSASMTAEDIEIKHQNNINKVIIFLKF